MTPSFTFNAYNNPKTREALNSLITLSMKKDRLDASVKGDSALLQIKVWGEIHKYLITNSVCTEEFAANSDMELEDHGITVDGKTIATFADHKELKSLWEDTCAYAKEKGDAANAEGTKYVEEKIAYWSVIENEMAALGLITKDESGEYPALCIQRTVYVTLEEDTLGSLQGALLDLAKSMGLGEEEAKKYIKKANARVKAATTK